MDNKTILVSVKWAVFAVLCALGFVASCSNVSSGTVGVLRHFGAVDPIPLQPGIHFTQPWPFASVEEVNTQIGATEGEALAASTDLQSVKTKVAIQWAILPSSAPQVIQGFGSEGKLETAILTPAIQEVVKAVSARYTAEELITKRNEVKLGIETELNSFVQKTLLEKNAVGAIKLANVAVTNFEFSADFNNSIEAKVKAEQDSLRAKNEMNTRVTQAEAKAKEVTLAAQAEADSKKLTADATAYQTDAESKARAAAITREAEALRANPGLVQLRIAEGWDGHLPTYTGGGIPLLQLGK
jgi:regulator of protease activity HflC (stomatin/prohibitin superfamily)